MMKVLPVLIGATMLLGACTSLPDNSPKTPVVHVENKIMKQQTIKSKYSFEQTIERLTDLCCQQRRKTFGRFHQAA